MSRERLEEIIDDLPYSIRYSGEIEPLKQHAREQDERVEELEYENQLLKGGKGIKSVLNDKAVEIIKDKEQKINYLRNSLEDEKEMNTESEEYIEELQSENNGFEKTKQTLP